MKKKILKFLKLDFKQPEIYEISINYNNFDFLIKNEHDFYMII